MKLKDTPATRDLNAVYREIQRLELEPNVAELEVFGFTVIEDAMPMAAVERAREVILDLAEQRMGRRPDLETQERYKDDVPEDVLERRGNDPRFRTLMGGDTSYGWTEDGPTAEHRLRSRAGANWFS